ncbi:MAG: PilZ domain-containing protein [Pseudolabrys sp.]
MEERRKVQCHRVLKAGRIGFNHAAGIDCSVSSLSSAGACLDVASPIGVPDYFMLMIDSDRLRQACHVIWREGCRMGVEFCADEQPVPPQAA